MADTKRQNTGGKVPVATPNIGPSGPVSVETAGALGAAIGSKIRLQTIPPTARTLEGILFTVSPSLNLLTMTISNPNSPVTYHILPISAVQSFNMISLPSPTNAPGPLAPLDPNFLASRLDAAVARLKAEDARRGKGVTKEAQAIFDAIGRTLPTRWDGTNIVVLDAVVIEAPYRAGDCKAGSGAAKDTLGRVKMTLEAERKKLAEKSGNSGGGRPVVPAAVPLSGPRKGG